jgi:transposase-like protein
MEDGAEKQLRRPRRSFPDEFKAGAVWLVLAEGRSAKDLVPVRQ